MTKQHNVFNPGMRIGEIKMKHTTKVYWIILIAYGITLFFDDGVRTGTNILLVGIFYYLFTIAKWLGVKE